MACSWGRDVHSPSVEQILLKFVEGRKERRQERDMQQVKHLLRIKQNLSSPRASSIMEIPQLKVFRFITTTVHQGVRVSEL